MAKKKPTGTGLLIRNYLKSNDITQEEFCEILAGHGEPVYQSTISAWIWKGVPPGRVVQISAATGIPVVDLLG